MRSSRFQMFGLLVLAAALTGCAATEDTAIESGQDTDEIARSSTRTSVYFRIRRDQRRCVSPLCGGAWVTQVNSRTTRCADDSVSAECYVADIDWSALGLSERALPEFQNTAIQGSAVVRGRLRQQEHGTFGLLGQLVVTEGWQAATDATPTGSFYQVRDSGRRCIAAPCFSIEELRLNTAATPTASDVDLSRVAGVTAEDIDKGIDYLHNAPEGILVAGLNRNVADAGPAGDGVRLVASQFYFRVSPGVSESQFCNADSECTMTAFTQPVRSSDDCYCTFCNINVVNQTTADALASGWTRHCSSASRRAMCPQVRCIAPAPTACQNHGCVEVARP